MVSHGFPIHARTLTGAVHSLAAKPTATNNKVEHVLESIDGLPSCRLNSAFQREIFDDRCILSDCGVENCATDHCVSRGGQALLLDENCPNGAEMLLEPVLSTTPANRAQDVPAGDIVITAYFDRHCVIMKTSSGEVDANAVIVTCCQRADPQTKQQCHSRVFGVVSYDDDAHSLAFRPNAPIPPNTHVHVTLLVRSQFLRLQERRFWFDTANEPSTQLLVYRPLPTTPIILCSCFSFGTARQTNAPADVMVPGPAVSCDFRVTSTKPMRDLYRTIAAAIGTQRQDVDNGV